MNILLSGGCGFIGLNLLHLLLRQKNICSIVNLDKLTYAANTNALQLITNNLPQPQVDYHFYQGDISDPNIVDMIFDKHNIDVVINLAAETHVDNSITSPQIFFQSNIIGTTTLLNIAKKY